MSRVTTSDFRAITSAISTYAADLGLIPKGTGVQYWKGNQSNGIAATLEVVKYSENGDREVIRVPDFLPTFTYKTTQAQQYRELAAVYKVLTAMIRVNNEEHGWPKPVIETHPAVG